MTTGARLGSAAGVLLLLVGSVWWLMREPAATGDASSTGRDAFVVQGTAGSDSSATPNSTAVPRSEFQDLGVDEAEEARTSSASRAADALVVEGRVVDESEIGVGGAKVRLFAARSTGGMAALDPLSSLRALVEQPAPRAETVSSDDGSFAFENVRPGEWSVVASAAGRTTSSEGPFEVGRAFAAAPLRLRLGPGRTRNGVVRDSAGRPIADAEVEWAPIRPMSGTPPAHGRARSDAEGRFAFSELGDEDFALFARAASYAPHVRSVSKGETDVIEVVLRRGAVIRGRAFDVATNAPLAGVRFVAATFDSTTGFAFAASDAEGKYEISPAPVGKNVFLIPSIAGYSIVLPPSPEDERGAPLGGASALPIGDVPENSVVLKDVAFAGGASISGFVVDETGSPLSGADVYVRHASHFELSGPRMESAATDLAGAFTIAPAAPGHIRLVAEKTGFESGPFGELETDDDSADVETEAEDAELSLQAGEHRKGVRIVLRRGAAVSGVVVDEADRPVSGATVVWVRPEFAESGGSMFEERPARRRTSTDANGRFRCEGLPRKPLLWLAAHPDYPLGGSLDWTPPQGGDAPPIKIVVSAGAALVGTLHYPDGRPAANVAVQWAPKDPRSRAGMRSETREFVSTTDAGGSFKLVGLPPGEGLIGCHWSNHSLWRQAGPEAPADGWSPYLISFHDARRTIVKGRVETVSLRLLRTVSISGTVVDEAGVPLGGAHLNAEPSDPVAPNWSEDPFTLRWMAARSEPDGSFSMHGLDERPYTLDCRWQGGASEPSGKKPERRVIRLEKIDGGRAGLRFVLKKP